MSGRRSRGFVAAWPVLLALPSSSCGGVAAAFLDLPEEPRRVEEVAPAPGAASGTGQVVQEVEPPPIESVESADSVLKLLPRDNAGHVDWVAAVRDGTIMPRGKDGRPRGPAGAAFAFDFFFESENEMFEAYFPHSAHVDWLDCRSCHPALYRYRGAEITMGQINAGESCGTCHGTVAFPADDCERCHKQMQMPAGRVEARFLGARRMTRAVVDTLDISQQGAEMFPAALFPHGMHRVRLQCSACHPEPYEARSGASTTSMAAMAEGDSCGACHGEGKIAFGLLQCDRCHVREAEAD